MKGRRSRDSSTWILGTKRTALFLYAVLVVLPAAVFGWLHWHQLVEDHRTRLEAVPENLRSTAARLATGVRQALDELLAGERARPFYHYQPDYYRDGAAEDVAFLHSPLVVEPRPLGIEAWFVYDFYENIDADVLVFGGARSDPEEWRVERERLRGFVDANLVRDRIENKWGPPYEHVETVTLRAAAMNLAAHRDMDCLRRDVGALAREADRPVEVQLSDFRLRLMRGNDGTRRVVATRRVMIPGQSGDLALTDCFDAVRYTTILEQGFFLDPQWLFRTLPSAISDQVLQKGSQRLWIPDRGGASPAPTDLHVLIDLALELGLEVDHARDRDAGLVRVVTSLTDLERRFRAQSFGFWSVAAVMVVSLAVGMGLLVRSVQASLEQARRTENFVAAITHELRTPITAVKMYGEMLREGWFTEPEKREEYLDRIVRESDRLDDLVDRVLQKSRLGSESPEPRPGDLSEVVRELAQRLSLSGSEDLEFELEPDLPPVPLARESIEVILVNLVENARKYAPVPPARPGAPAPEPVRIRTGRHKGRVVLEVADRGPGIPESERGRIFEAFYRVGDERTRRTRGTGLGLHLVALQARAMRARVSVLPRPGGGSIFRVTFRRAKGA